MLGIVRYWALVKCILFRNYFGMLKNYLLSRLYSSKQVSRNMYEVFFYHNGEPKKIVYSVPSRPSFDDIEYVVDGQGNAVTETVRTYLGPDDHPFRIKAPTPAMFGFARIVVGLGDCERVFESNDKVDVSIWE